MKISIVVTLLNEENTIDKLIDSLENQTIVADEIIIVDGGSKDQTIEIIKNRQSINPKIKLIQEKGNIAKGRNIGISAARNEIIAQTDGGCVANSNWLEKVTAPLEDSSIGLVAGFYEMTGDTPFQKAIAPFHGIPKSKFDPRHYMPSGRSVSFKKKVWKQIGGYSESLNRAGEDTLFNYRLLKADIKIKRVKSAIVYWEVPQTFWQSIGKFYHYAIGDAQAAIWWHPAQGLMTHNIKIISIFARYILALLLLVMALVHTIFLFILIIVGVLYMFWPIWKMRDIIHEIKPMLYLPLIQISSDITVMVGFITGMVLRI